MAIQSAATPVVGAVKVWVLPAAPTTYGYYFPWSLGFVEEPRLIPKTASRTARGGGTATFDYLRAFRDEGAGLINLPGNVVAGAYVCITMGTATFAYASVVWWGYIASIDKIGFSGAIDVMGTVTALGIGRLLDGNILAGFRQDGHGSAAIPLLTTPTANMSTEAGEIVGNKVSGLDDSGHAVPVFADVPANCGTAAGNFWSRYDILNHVLRFCSPAGIPAFNITGSTGLSSYLADTTSKEVYELYPLTMAGLLDLVLSRAHGFGWDLFPASDGTWTIYGYATNDDATPYGSGYPAQTATNIDVSGTQTAQVRYTEDATDLVDAVTVEGANIIVGATVAVSDGNLFAGWSSSQLTTYRNGAQGAAGYSALTPENKMEANTQYRAQPGLRDVFELFGLYPGSASLTRSATPGLGAGSLPLIPNVTWDGTTATVDDTTGRLPYLPSLRLCRFIPWQAGIQGDGTDTRAATQKAYPAYLEPRVFRYSSSPPSGEGAWMDLLADWKKRSSPSVSCDDRGPGLRIAFTPREIMAKGNWTEGTDGIAKINPNTDPYARAINYANLVCTIGIPSDQRISVTKYRNGLLASTARRSVKLSYEHLQCWVMLAGSVIGVKNDGSAESVLTTTIVRNDWPTIERLATLYAAFFFRKRNAAVIELAVPSSPPGYGAIGQLIGQITERAQFGNTSALVTSAYTVVESLNYDFSDSPRLTISTSLPDNSMFSSGGGGASPAMGGSVSASLGSTPAQAIKQIQNQGQKTKAACTRSTVVESRVSSSTAAGNAITETGISQVAHGFALGDIVYNSGGTWSKSKADAVATAQYAGVVSGAASPDSFDVTYAGVVTGLSGLTAGTIYYLSDAVAGGKIAKGSLGATAFPIPVMLAESTTQAYVFPSSLIAADTAGMRMDFGSSNTVALSAADFVGTSRSVKLREIDVCIGGVAKKMLVLCSDFY